jgi:hypothetical protein
VERGGEETTRSSTLAARRLGVIDEPKTSGVVFATTSGSFRKAETTPEVFLHPSSRTERRELVAHDEAEIGTTISTRATSSSRVRRGTARAGRTQVLMYLNNHFSAKAVANAPCSSTSSGSSVPGDYPRRDGRPLPGAGGRRRYFGLARFERERS